MDKPSSTSEMHNFEEIKWTEIENALSDMCLKWITIGEYVVVMNNKCDVTIGGEPYQAWVRSPNFWSRSKIKIIANDLDQNLKRSKITAIDLDHCKIKDQDHWSWSLILKLHLFSKRSIIKINILVISLFVTQWKVIMTQKMSSIHKILEEIQSKLLFLEKIPIFCSYCWSLIAIFELFFNK